MYKRLVVVAALLAAGCAGEKVFEKSGTSAALLDRDSQNCWKQAQAVNITEDQKNASAVGALIGGGPVALVTSIIVNSAEESDPKNGVRRQAHDACMAKRGYKTAPPKAS
jgi:hypothetical protein